MQKPEIRTLFLERRQSLSPDELHGLSQKIADVFFESIDLAEVRVLHVFLPIQRLREIDSQMILRRLWAGHPNIRTVVPRTNFESGELESVAIDDKTKVEQNHWGISEPVDSAVVDSQLIDIVLVPLLAFDRRGHRVGYGKGFYDRYLKTCRNDCSKVGLSLFAPIEQIEGTNDRDVILDSVVTPNGIYRYKPEAIQI